MGAVSGLLGTGGGAAGSGFSAPEEGVSVANTREAAIKQLAQQQQFANAMNPNALQAAQSQQGLLQQLQDGANGQGPNPALNQLNQTTGQNVANQAALMASQRGASANPGLIARQAAMQGSNAQQQAVGQAATMQAQQQQGYMQQLAAQQAQIVGQGQNSLNSAQNGANQIYGTASGLQSNINQGNAALANQNMQGQQGLIGGALNAAGSLVGFADGGQVPVEYNATPIAQVAAPAAASAESNPIYKGMSSFGKYLSLGGQQSDTDAKNGYAMADKVLGAPGSNPQTILPAGNFEGVLAAKGGKVPAMVSPGERYLKPHDVEKVKRGANPMEVGEKIPGKPKVGGAKNSYANDTVSKTLDEGGLVLPRSVTQSKHPHWAALNFVKAHLAKGGIIPAKPPLTKTANKGKIK